MDKRLISAVIFGGVWGIWWLVVLFPYVFPNEKLLWSVCASEAGMGVVPIAILSFLMNGFLVRQETGLGMAVALGIFVIWLGILLGIALTIIHAYCFAPEPQYVYFIVMLRLVIFLPSAVVPGGVAGYLLFLICHLKVAS